MKEYSFQMTKEEVREICLRVMWERLLFHPFKCLLLLAILILEGVFVSWIVTVLLVLFVLVMVVLGTVRGNTVMREQLCEKTQTMRVEEGMLKQEVEGGLHSEVRCSSITKVRMTRRLLMLGFSQAPKIIAWYAVPLRVFADRQDRDSFLESVRNRQTAEESAAASSEDCEAPAAERSEQEYFSLSFPVGEEEWIRAMADATEIIQAGTLGEQKDRFGWIAYVAVFSVLLCGAARFFPSVAAILHIVSFMGIIIILLYLKSLSENPERNIRGRFRRGTVQNNVLGVWETSFTEQGIRQSISGKNSVMMPWESLLCAVETDNELFFYQKDKRHFGMLLKGGPECREKLESLKELCREKQVEILAGKRKKYAPNWLFPLLIVAVAVGYVWLLSGDMLPGYTWGSESTGSPESAGIRTPEPAGMRIFTEEEVKVTPRREQYDFAVAMEYSRILHCNSEGLAIKCF